MLTGFSEAAAFAVFSPDGHRVVTGGPDFTAKVWDSVTLREIGTLAGHEGLVRWADFSPDGRRIVTASRDRTAMIWDAETARKDACKIEHDISEESFAAIQEKLLAGK